MRLCARNKSNLQYALYKGSEPVYATDDDGNTLYEEIDGENVPVEIGTKPPRYDNPVSFKGCLQYSKGEVEAKSYGVDTSYYDYTLLMEKDAIPIDETTLIFHTSEPEYDASGLLIEKSADFRVRKVAPTLNFTTYLLKAIEK